jgi:hypothetical protein
VTAFDPTAPLETWHPLPTLPGYELSNRFVVRRLTPAGWEFVRLNPDRNGRGYVYFWAHHDTRSVHACVAEIVLGPRPPRMLVRHLDDDPRNNHPSNLAYGTMTDNIMDAVRNGRLPRVKMSPAKAREMRDLRRDGWEESALSERFGLSIAATRAVLAGRSWVDPTYKRSPLHG